jgi:hypothetical protein
MNLSIVMAGLVPDIHVFGIRGQKWMPGTSPGMTMIIRMRAAAIVTPCAAICPFERVSPATYEISLGLENVQAVWPFPSDLPASQRIGGVSVSCRPRPPAVARCGFDRAEKTRALKFYLTTLRRSGINPARCMTTL